MAMVIFMSHCVFSTGKVPFFVVEKMKANSLITCSVKCNFVNGSSRFWYNPTIRDKYKIENRHTKMKTKKKNIKTNLESGACYCLSQNNKRVSSLKINNSRLCLFNSANGKSKPGERQMFQKTTVKSNKSNKASEAQPKRKKKTMMGKNHKSENDRPCKTCRCKKGSNFNRKLQRCEKKTRPKRGRPSCVKNKDCGGKLKICWDGICKCKPAYYQSERTKKCQSGCSINNRMTAYPKLRIKGQESDKRYRFKQAFVHTTAVKRCIHKCTTTKLICIYASLEVATHYYLCHVYFETTEGRHKNAFYSRKDSNGYTFLQPKCD